MLQLAWAICWVFCLGLAPRQSPLWAATDKPWAVENPAGAEARFGLGLGFYAERQEGLEIAFQRTMTELSIPGQEAVTTVVPGDPDLLNRKFDPEWGLEGPVVQIPIALRTLWPRGARPLYSSLVLELTRAEIDLDIHDRSAPELGGSLSGDGVMAGAWLDLVMPLCHQCPWFAGGGFRYRALPEMAVDRSPPFAAPGFAVTADEASLSGRAHEAFLRWGYAPRDSRFATYAGVRFRSTSITVDDELRLVSDQTHLVTHLTTRTRFESEGVLAMVGVDVHLGGRVFGRVEAGYGEGDASVLVKVVYLEGSGRGRGAGTAGEGAASEEAEPTDSAAERARAERIAAEIAPRLLAGEASFRSGFGQLFPPSIEHPSPRRNEVDSLLSRNEADLLQGLGAPELAALRDYVRAEFEQARRELWQAEGPERVSPPRAPPLAASGSLPALRFPGAVLHAFARFEVARDSMFLAQQPSERIDDKGALPIFSRVSRLYRLLLSLAETNDLVVQLCIRSRPVQRAEFVMYPESYPPGKHTVNTDGRLVNVYRGLYLYRVSRHGHKTVESRLDLVDDSRPLVVCELVEASSPEPALSCDRRNAPIEECNDHG